MKSYSPSSLQGIAFQWFSFGLWIRNCDFAVSEKFLSLIFTSKPSSLHSVAAADTFFGSVTSSKWLKIGNVKSFGNWSIWSKTNQVYNQDIQVF